MTEKHTVFSPEMQISLFIIIVCLSIILLYKLHSKGDLAGDQFKVSSRLIN